MLKRLIHKLVIHPDHWCYPAIRCDVCWTYLRGREGQKIKQLRRVAASYGWRLDKKTQFDMCPQCVLTIASIKGVVMEAFVKKYVTGNVTGKPMGIRNG